VPRVLRLIDRRVFSTCSIYLPVVVSDISGFVAQVSTNMTQGEGNDQARFECSEEKYKQTVK